MEEADILVTCPYNPAHRIRKYKLMNHIAKCKKTSKVMDKAECPLDKSHIVDRDHLKEHIASCSSLGKLIDIDPGCDQPKLEVEPVIMNAYSNENWEEEPEVPSYDPMEISSKKPVIRCVSGLTKSEKKKFRDNERMRIANLKGLHSTSEASSSMGDMVYEAPLRPPRDADILSTRISQNNIDSSAQIHHHSDCDANAEANFAELHNDSFRKKLYDELAPEDDNLERLEQSLRNTDEKISLEDFLPRIKEDRISTVEQNQEKVKKSETDATSELFNRKKEKDECIASTSSVSDERVTDKLLALLKNESSVKEIQPMKETIKIDQTKKDLYEKGPALEEIISKFNERLSYLTGIQNAAAEETAQILKQLKELGLY